MSTAPKVLAIIPARGKSKGLPRKNVLDTGGKPLIAWTIEAAQKANCVTKLILSSDNAEIISVAKDFGCDVPFIRPDNLATDTASTLDVVLHSIEQMPGYDFVIILQPTSPLRTAWDIDAAFDIVVSTGAPSCVSVCEVDETPYWMFSLGKNGQLERLIDLPSDINRRQDLPKSYKLNGAIYIIEVNSLIKTKSFISDKTVAYIMDRGVSIDVDTHLEHEHVKKILE